MRFAKSNLPSVTGESSGCDGASDIKNKLQNRDDVIGAYFTGRVSLEKSYKLQMIFAAFAIIYSVNRGCKKSKKREIRFATAEER